MALVGRVRRASRICRHRRVDDGSANRADGQGKGLHIRRPVRSQVADYRGWAGRATWASFGFINPLRRLMRNSVQRRRSPDRMLHQTLSKGWCRHGSGLLLGLIVRLRRRLVEARALLEAATPTRSACIAHRLGGFDPGHPRPVAPLQKREGLLALRLLSPALLLPEPLFAGPVQPKGASPANR